MKNGQICIEVAADPRLLGTIRSLVRTYLAEAGFDRERTDEVVLGVDEACTNAIRHGRVTQVTIELATAEGTLTLSVQDNGRGFDERNASINGLGLRLMRYRAQMLGGDVTIAGNKGGGAAAKGSAIRKPSANKSK